MPFGALERPALGLSLLKPGLERQGFPCDVSYLTTAFAEFIGLEEYLWVQSEVPYTAFPGDWAFTSSLYGARPGADRRYLDEVLRGTWQFDDESIARVLRIRAYCEPFLDHCLRSIDWAAYDVVGFTSTFEQNIASLALAKRVKRAVPRIVVVFGGANWEDEMGRTLHASFPFVDYVCSGEADLSFPALVAALAEGSDPADVPGIVFRRNGRSVATGAPALLRDLDVLPVADFSDYVLDHDRSPVASAVTPMMLLETSRGCWWGAKHHCTFCGLNGGAMTFRSKSPDRVLTDIATLREDYSAEAISVVDNILDMRFFKTLLPRMERLGVHTSLFYEVKANLNHAQVRQLWASGIHRIQPGVESFSDHVLQLMRKGTTALQNVQLLKWCAEFGIRADWNLLYGFPGEDAADYERMAGLLGRITHLQPPTAFGPIRLDRFSPYHDDPAAFGMVNVRPLEPFSILYPFEPADLIYADGRDPMDYARPVLAFVQGWMQSGPRGGQWQRDGEADAVRIVVEREDGVGSVELDGWRAQIYRLCDRVSTMSSLCRSAGLEDVRADAVHGFLRWAVDSGLMLEDGDRFLALAVHQPARTDPATAEETREPIAVLETVGALA